MIHHGDCLDILKAIAPSSFHTCVTSPPYWGLRDYGVEGQLGLEKTPDEYVSKVVEVFREVRRVLRDDGTLWLNLGDSYANAGGKQQPHRDNNGGFTGSPGTRTQRYALAGGGFERPHSIGSGIKPKDLVGIPWRVAFALQADGWYLRQDIIWHKPNPMPESVRDRCTKAHEYIFLLSKSEKYFFDSDAIKEPFADKRMGNPNSGGHYAKAAFTLLGEQKGLSKEKWNEDGSKTGRNRRSVWTVTTKPFKGAHFATFPPDLIEPCVLAGCPEGGTVLDPFFGAGTTGLVATKHKRRFVGIELNEEYIKLAEKRLGVAR